MFYDYPDPLQVEVHGKVVPLWRNDENLSKEQVLAAWKGVLDKNTELVAKVPVEPVSVEVYSSETGVRFFVNYGSKVYTP